MRSLLPLFLIATLLLFSCKSQPEKDREKLTELRKDYWKDKNSEADVNKAATLDSAYKAYVNAYPQDTLNPELLFENARLHISTLNHPDQALVLLEQLYRQYPDHPRAPEAVYQSGFVLENELQLPNEARRQYEYLIEKYPNHPFAKEAQVTLKFLGKDPAEMLKAIQDSANAAKPDTLAAGAKR